MTGRTWLRRIGLIAAVIVFLAACTDSATTTTTTAAALPQPSSPITVITFPPLDADLVVGTDRYVGYLPDGTDYVVYLDTTDHEEVTAITADLMYQRGRQTWSVGPVAFHPRLPADGPSFVAGVLTLPVGDTWTATITVDQEFLDFLGPDAEKVLESSIVAAGFGGTSTRTEFPVLDIEPPFRWSTNHDPTGPMEVAYETFSVRPGCDQNAAACTWTGFLQVVPATGYQALGVDIDSQSPRPKSDPNYLAAGPFWGDRQGLDVFWADGEMIVWGGKSLVGKWQSGGAAFDPTTNRWRTFDGPPIGPEVASRAVWGDGRMVVVTDDATYEGDPTTDTWTETASGVEPPGYPNRMIAVDDRVYLWVSGAIMELAPGEPRWKELPDLGVPRGESWLLSFLEWDGRLLVSRLPAGRCQGHEYWAWSGGSWEKLPDVSLSTESWADCSLAYQAAIVDDRLIVWDDNQHPTKRYDAATGIWTEIETIPMKSWESPPGALLMDDRVLVPSAGEGVIYDSTIGSWETVDLPGSGFATQMVWTGGEVLAWDEGRGGAWRWTPPDPSS